jgi:hypothetical protein
MSYLLMPKTRFRSVDFDWIEVPNAARPDAPTGSGYGTLRVRLVRQRGSVNQTLIQSKSTRRANAKVK